MTFSDRSVERLVKESRLGAIVRSAAAVGRASWQESRTHRGLQHIRATATSGGSTGVIRFNAVVVVAASTIVILLQSIEPFPRTRFAWVLPLICGAAAVAAWVFAGAIANACRDRRT